MDKINYSFVLPDEGTFVFRSKVESFGLEHLTDKDITSFYVNFSNNMYYDTGLLPVNGTGLLSLRKALNHTQITYQMAPDIYHVNWGSYEGDPTASTYVLAQPYKIIVADLINENFYGARTFYSPVPITYYENELYHVNLPNINCQGYNGTSVGWNCLYHNQDITDLTLSEKIINIIQRCSGVEAYNDANMNETDGPRFYRSYYQDNDELSYLWNPVEWQNKTEQEGIDWTIDNHHWIPIKVLGIDNQFGHSTANDSQNLTLYMAMFGDYCSYYSDPMPTKPVNALSRTDKSLPQDKIYTEFVKSFNSSSNTHTNFNQATSVAETRSNLSQTISPSIIDNSMQCDHCGELAEDLMPADIKGEIGSICISCQENYFVYIESYENLCHIEDENVIFSETYEEYLYLPHVLQAPHDECPNCKTVYPVYTYFDADPPPNYIYFNKESKLLICQKCDPSNDPSYCTYCRETIPNTDQNIVPYVYVNNYSKEDGSNVRVKQYVCYSCYKSKFNSTYTLEVQDPKFNPSYCLCGVDVSNKPQYLEINKMTTNGSTSLVNSIINSVGNICINKESDPDLYNKIIDNSDFFTSIQNYSIKQDDSIIQILFTSPCDKCMLETLNMSQQDLQNKITQYLNSEPVFLYNTFHELSGKFNIKEMIIDFINEHGIDNLSCIYNLNIYIVNDSLF